jgi:hypothetical protein
LIILLAMAVLVAVVVGLAGMQMIHAAL